MSLIFNTYIPSDGNPNGILDGPKNSLFYKSGSFYKINYDGVNSTTWQNVYFTEYKNSVYTLTEQDVSILTKLSGAFLYVKRTPKGNLKGWELLKKANVFIQVTPVLTPTPTPTSTPTPTPAGTSTPTPTPTPTPTSTPTPTPTATSTPEPTCPPRPPRPTPTPTATPTPTPTPTATPTPTPTPTATPTPTPTPTIYDVYAYTFAPGGSEEFP
jgi:hypothetical protein